MPSTLRLTGNTFQLSATLVACIVAAALSGCSSLRPQGTTVANRDVAPSFTLTNHEGQEVSLAELNGTGPVVVVFFRGPW